MAILEVLEGESNIRIKINTTEASKKLAKKLNQEISRGHENWVFVLVIVLTLIKTPISFIPIFGQAISLIITGTIYLLMKNKGFLLKSKIKFVWWLLFGGITFIQILPFMGPASLPLDIAVIFYAWYLVKKRMRKAESKLAILGQLTIDEMTALNENIDLLDLDKKGERSIYTSKGSLSTRSEKIIKEAKKILKESDYQGRPTQKAAVDDGVKRVENFRQTQKTTKASEEAKEYKISTSNGPYVEFDQKTGGMVPAEKEEEKPDDWPIAI